jgi:hypothetical protein
MLIDWYMDIYTSSHWLFYSVEKKGLSLSVTEQRNGSRVSETQSCVCSELPILGDAEIVSRVGCMVFSLKIRGWE